jgi:hypothetical protein
MLHQFGQEDKVPNLQTLPQGLKPTAFHCINVRAEARTLQQFNRDYPGLDERQRSAPHQRTGLICSLQKLGRPAWGLGPETQESEAVVRGERILNFPLDIMY